MVLLTPAGRRVLPCALGVTAVLLVACTSSVGGQPSGTTPVPWSSSEQSSESLPTWPSPVGDDLGESVEARSANSTPPTFPDHVEGYALSHEWRETIRAFEGEEWSTIFEYPATMNGCGLQRFYVRWRTVNVNAIVEATLLDSGGEIVLVTPASGGAGWMSSYGCGQPGFRMNGTVDPDDMSNLTDVVVEVQQWEAAV